MKPHDRSETRIAIEDHYATQGMRERLDAGLAAAGLATGPIDWKALASLDQFHTRGLLASQELADELGVKAGETVLDLGSGLGGPARFLAATRGCLVTGVELTPLYVEISNDLTARCGLADKATFVHGDVTRLAFPDKSFEYAWTLHVSMNIEDKAGFYREVHRVLRKGGKFALYDVARGQVEPALYPAPWAPVKELSFLASPAETAELLQAVGFSIDTFDDATQEAVDWFAAVEAAPVPEKTAHTIPTLAHLIGPQVGHMFSNIARNVKEGRTGILRAVVRKD